MYRWAVGRAPTCVFTEVVRGGFEPTQQQWRGGRRQGTVTPRRPREPRPSLPPTRPAASETQKLVLRVHRSPAPSPVLLLSERQTGLPPPLPNPRQRSVPRGARGQLWDLARRLCTLLPLPALQPWPPLRSTRPARARLRGWLCSLRFRSSCLPPPSPVWQRRGWFLPPGLT